MIFDYLERHEAEWDGWANRLIPTAIPGESTRLLINWPDFESYLNHLSKKTRRQYRMNCTHAEAEGIEITRHTPMPTLDEATLDRVVPLIHAVEEHHHSPPTPWTRPLLVHAGMVESTWLTADIQGRLVGCAMFFKDKDMGIMTLLGRDYAVDYAYFQLIYEEIACAIEAGLHTLRGGSGAYELKQKLNFELVSNNYIAYAATNRGLQQLARRFAPS